MWGNEPEQEEEKVDEVEITYIDPANGSVCQRQVFCDPEDWKDRFQARLLVSSDLVNSLTEACGIWFGRFRQIHQRLEDSRMGYYYELWSIRGHLQKLKDHDHRKDAQEARERALKEQEESADGQDLASPGAEEKNEGPEEVCPVHFFNPDLYLDSWTKDMLQRAIKSFRDQLNKEIAGILERINIIGCGTWRQVLALFLRQGQDPIELVVGLLHAIEDPLYRREIVNHLTNGLQDLYDALLAELDFLQIEGNDMNSRWQEIQDLGMKQKQGIVNAQQRMVDAAKSLEEPGFEEPPEEDDTEAVAEAQVQMFETKEASIKEYMLEVRRLRKVLQEWLDRVAAECDEEAIKDLEAQIKEWKRTRRVLNMRTEKYDEDTEECEARICKIQDKIQAQKDKCDALKTKLASIPSINPQTLKLKQLQREIRQLDAEEKRIKGSMAEPSNRIKAMRAQLRELYKKLGWDWDMSDSEDEDDGKDKPYWLRRKTAVNGFLPFNQQEFLYAEEALHKKRAKQLSLKLNDVQESSLVAQMKAKRQNVAGERDLALSRSIEIDEEEELGPKIFGSDEPSRDPIDPVQRAISSFRERSSSLPGQREGLLETPSWRKARQAEEHESRQNDLDRLLQLRESFESQLQQCVECFVELLPPSGSLGDLRARLNETLAKLRQLPEDPAAWEAQEVECHLEETCEALQYMIEEAISCGDQVHPISAAMMHSVRFSDLRTLLSGVLQSETEMREALKVHRSSRRRRFPQQEEISQTVSPSSSRRLLPCSQNSSPRLRGQTAPGGSIWAQGSDSGSDSGLGFAVAPHAFGGATPDELSESLRLPPRLLAQTMSLLGRQPSQPKKDMRKKVDFGFRPDGAGEDSLENWSLFKVSKANTSHSSGFGESVSTGMGLTTSSGFYNSDKMRQTETKVRRHRAAVDCDFHEYMSQARQMSSTMGDWQTSSTGSFIGQEKKKRFPKLPKLVHSKSAGNDNTAGGFPVKGDVLGGWERSPPRISMPSKRLSQTCTKW